MTNSFHKEKEANGKKVQQESAAVEKPDKPKPAKTK